MEKQKKGKGEEIRLIRLKGKGDRERKIGKGRLGP